MILRFYMGSAQTMRYHVNAMRRVVKLRGRLQDTVLDKLILQLIEWYVLNHSLKWIETLKFD
jgi:hypothetical protein